MDYSQTVANLNPDIIEKLKTAIELGRWENDDKLTPEQIESAMQTVMLWQAKNIVNNDTEPFIVNAKGGLYTGKGETHNLFLNSKIDNKHLITKKKV